MAGIITPFTPLCFILDAQSLNKPYSERVDQFEREREREGVSWSLSREDNLLTQSHFWYSW